MDTAVDEIAPGIFRLSTWIPGITEHGFTFNQFLLTGDEPFLFHTGQRFLFPQVAAAIERVLPMTSLRWISFGHLEADECGAMNLFLDAVPHAEVIHGDLACMLSLSDMAAIGCGSSRLRTSRTTGRPGCGSTRPPRRCSQATCSPTSASARRSPRPTSSRPHWTPRACSTRPA
jgi:hypothetical protein